MALISGKSGSFVKREAKLPQKIGALLSVLAAALALMFVSVSTAMAATFTVTNTNDSGEGSLRQAIMDANSNAGADTIVFGAGVTGTIALTSGRLNVTDDLTIEGPGQENLTISGNNISAVLQVFPGVTFNLEGVTVADGNGPDLGGGINNAGTLNVTDSTLSGNTSNGGGGIFNSGTLTVANSTLSDNSAVLGGGGIWNDTDGMIEITDSILSGNTAGILGGGIINGGTLNVTGSTLWENTADDDGGGIWNQSIVTVTNSTLSGNSAVLGGGGIRNFRGTLDVINTTLAENQATTGGGISNGTGTATLHNTIVANNSGNNCAGVITDVGGNLSWPDDGTCPGIHEDPLLGSLQDNGGPTQTMALAPESPAIDAAVDPWPATDQRGVPRPQGAAADIGAFELEFCVILIQEKWDSLGGAPGDPLGDVYEIPGGLARDYEVGRLICNEAAGAAYWLYGPILAKYDSIGAYTSPLRLPVSDVEDHTYWAKATFQGGWIYWWPSRGAVAYRNATSIINGW